VDYQYKNGKYIIQKDGVYFSISPEQMLDFIQVAHDIYADYRLEQFHGNQDNLEAPQ